MEPYLAIVLLFFSPRPITDVVTTNGITMGFIWSYQSE
jgi:hypothetical protein